MYMVVGSRALLGVAIAAPLVAANQSCKIISMHEIPLMSCLYVRQLSYLSYNALAWHSMRLMRGDGEIAVEMPAPGGIVVAIILASAKLI